MENIKSLISHHNKKVLSRANNKNDQEISTCKCRNKDSCLLNGKCLQENVVYKATITTQNKSKEYIGYTGGPFKKRWYTLISDIRNEKRKGTELSKCIWKLKPNSKSFSLNGIMHKIRELKNVGKTSKIAT